MKLVTHTLFFLVILLLSSCFDIVEEVTLNKDGSGKFKFTANLSQSKTKLKSIMLMDQINGYKVPSKEKISAEIDKIVLLAKRTKGISNVQSTVDYDEFIVTFSCNFTRVEALNGVVKNFRVSNKFQGSNQDIQYEYHVADKIFYRRFDANLKQEFEKLKSKDKLVLEGASYVSIFRFENEILSATNDNSKLSKNKKASLLRVAIKDIVNQKAGIVNAIQLKK